MQTEIALTARRFAVTLAFAGVATIGSFTLATAASAEVVGTSTATGSLAVVEPAAVAPAPTGRVVDGVGTRGPDAFIRHLAGRTPVFFCDADKPRMHHGRCIDLTGSTRF